MNGESIMKEEADPLGNWGQNYYGNNYSDCNISIGWICRDVSRNRANLFNRKG